MATRAKSSPPAAPAGSGAWSFIPERPTLPALVRAAQTCKACELYKNATQAVLGAGGAGAHLMLVGEQPGDKEDLAGQPFVGPAGRLLDELLEGAGISRREVYLTNAVKHFKCEPRGKVRLHQKPTLREVTACRPWLETEIALVRPRGIVCLGATALQALRGGQARITRDHGQFFDTPWGSWLTATFHPSAVLRMPDAAKRREARAQLQHDLELAARRLAAA
ncbi:MAG: UdgX family uracil-DNA binding protein [Acidobacteria bacterium]|nr:UdgX family uracil-DNA binding protein [Acidobacteriota bacterium]